MCLAALLPHLLRGDPNATGSAERELVLQIVRAPRNGEGALADDGVGVQIHTRSDLDGHTRHEAQDLLVAVSAFAQRPESPSHDLDVDDVRRFDHDARLEARHGVILEVPVVVLVLSVTTGDPFDAPRHGVGDADLGSDSRTAATDTLRAHARRTEVDVDAGVVGVGAPAVRDRALLVGAHVEIIGDTVAIAIGPGAAVAIGHGMHDLGGRVQDMPIYDVDLHLVPVRHVGLAGDDGDHLLVGNARRHDGRRHTTGTPVGNADVRVAGDQLTRPLEGGHGAGALHHSDLGGIGVDRGLDHAHVTGRGHGGGVVGVGAAGENRGQTQELVPRLVDVPNLEGVGGLAGLFGLGKRADPRKGQHEQRREGVAEGSAEHVVLHSAGNLR